MSTADFQKQKTAYELCISDTLQAFLARQNNQPEYMDDDGVAEAHEQAWLLLSEDQRKQIWGLSSDLYSLSDNEKRPDLGEQPDEQTLVASIEESYSKGNWNQLLHWFRFQPKFDRNLVDYMRGRAWAEYGFPRIALAFFDNASRISPSTPTYRFLAMQQVKELRDWDELERRCERNAQALPDDATMQLLVGELYHDLAMIHADRKMDQNAIRHLDRGFELAEKQEMRDSVLGSAAASKAFALMNLQNVDETIPFLTKWINRLPDNADLRTTRGIIFLTQNYPKAIEDFERAIELGTSLALPYLEVAKTKARQEKFKEVSRLCRLGVGLSHRDAEVAEFHHLLGLAAFYQSNKQLAARELKHASMLSPFNTLINRNEQQILAGGLEVSMPKESLQSPQQLLELMSIR